MVTYKLRKNRIIHDVNVAINDYCATHRIAPKSILMNRYNYLLFINRLNSSNKFEYISSSLNKFNVCRYDGLNITVSETIGDNNVAILSPLDNIVMERNFRVGIDDYSFDKEYDIEWRDIWLI